MAKTTSTKITTMANLHPGNGQAWQLKNYWTKGKGLTRWTTNPHPWTTHLPDELLDGSEDWYFIDEGTGYVWPAPENEYIRPLYLLSRDLTPAHPLNDPHAEDWSTNASR